MLASLSRLPPEWPEDLLPAIRKTLSVDGRVLVVLDDDPTGTQTVHGIPVLTVWDIGSIVQELRAGYPAFFILTNSRAMTEPQARALNREIGTNLYEASQQAGVGVSVVSRSDSTLRGHYPTETDALAGTLGQQFDATLIIPFFLEGGRYTLDNVHYVAEEGHLIPAARTPFARDAVFGYQSSDLRQWVEEKTDGRVRACDVISLSLDTLRLGGSEAAKECLHGLHNNTVCVVNAASYRDMEVLSLALLEAEAAGKRFLYRTAASFVRTRAGIGAADLLTAADLGLHKGGGLFVVGSYVPKTSSQLSALLETDIDRAEINVPRLLNEATRQQEIRACASALHTSLEAGRDVALYTSRAPVIVPNAGDNLAIGQSISRALVALVKGLQCRPRYIVAKGGITASDTATGGLGIRRALVRGQMLPGVPVWEAGVESRFPGTPLIVFPGNVGDTDSLAQMRHLLGN